MVSHGTQCRPSAQCRRGRDDEGSGFSKRQPLTAFELQEGDSLILKGRVKNTEDQPWLCENSAEEEAYKIGVRVMHERHPDEVLLDFRGPTIKKNIFLGDWFDFEIKSDTTGFGLGPYRLKSIVCRMKQRLCAD